MRKTILSATVAALALGTAGIAVADHHGAKPNPDTNSDGVVSLAEAKAHAAKRFERMDANNDGQIDKADREARQAARFAKIDTNGDGELSQAEMTAAREMRQSKRAERRAQMQERRFERLDTDNSGGISEAELAAAHEARRERREARGDRRGKRAEMRRGHRGGKGRMMGMLRGADTNKDMIITRAEFDAAVEARFARVDTDNSGTITTEEREAAREQMREQRGAR